MSQQTDFLPQLRFDISEATRILRLSRATLYGRIRADRSGHRRTDGGVTSPPRNCSATSPGVADTSGRRAVPQLVGNSWAWFRAFLSEDGPKDRETRLTLVGHLRFMQGNGRGCWAGARTIGVTTWQNKATVLRHRAKAIEAGWLVPAPAGKSRSAAARHGGGLMRQLHRSVHCHSCWSSLYPPGFLSTSRSRKLVFTNNFSRPTFSSRSSSAAVRAFR